MKPTVRLQTQNNDLLLSACLMLWKFEKVFLCSKNMIFLCPCSLKCQALLTIVKLVKMEVFSHFFNEDRDVCALLLILKFKCSPSKKYLVCLKFESQSGNSLLQSVTVCISTTTYANKQHKQKMLTTLYILIWLLAVNFCAQKTLGLSPAHVVL